LPLKKGSQLNLSDYSLAQHIRVIFLKQAVPQNVKPKSRRKVKTHDCGQSLAPAITFRVTIGVVVAQF
jgi:hypothetical protein